MPHYLICKYSFNVTHNIIKHFLELVTNTFLANVLILYPLKIPDNLWFSGVFRGYKMGTLARNGLNKIVKTILKRYYWSSVQRCYQSAHSITLALFKSFLPLYFPKILHKVQQKTSQKLFIFRHVICTTLRETNSSSSLDVPRNVCNLMQFHPIVQ